MNRIFSLSVFVLLLFIAPSCHNDSAFPGFSDMGNGVYMKYYEHGESDQSPRLQDGVTFEMSQYFNDSLIFTTVGDAPMEMVLEKGAFMGDVSDVLTLMHIGDSVRTVVLADSVFAVVMGMDAPEEYAGKPIYYDLKLLSITPYEELQAKRQHYLDSLRMVEQEQLEQFCQNTRNSLTESGLIIFNKKGGGPVAKTGDFVNFDFLMKSISGDTIMCSYGIESVDMQYGEEFVCKGFDEALGMVGKGGSMSFLIPSNLAFDSVGYADVIPPYAPLMVEMKMIDIMDKDQHDKKMAELEAKHEAEREKQMAIEKQLIEKYVKDNGIVETPSETGLYLIWKEKGEGDLAKWGETASIHYILSNLNGDVIESSYNYQPIPFVIGKNEMLPSIEEAVMQMNPGSQVRLIVPSELGFGEVEVDPELLPANSPLIVDLELVGVK